MLLGKASEWNNNISIDKSIIEVGKSKEELDKSLTFLGLDYSWMILILSLAMVSPEGEIILVIQNEIHIS